VLPEDSAPTFANHYQNSAMSWCHLISLKMSAHYTRANDTKRPILQNTIKYTTCGDEAPFETILGPNIIGAYNIWEAAHRQGLKRVVYASSIHAVGMHKKQDFIGTDRPDTFYGLAKCFAEDLASLYWDKRGLESVCMRILSCAQVNNTRALGSWLSYADLIQMVTRAIDTPTTGFTVVYGVSNNDRATVDNTNAILHKCCRVDRLQPSN